MGQNECLCGSSRPKGSLKIVLGEISQNSQEIYAGISFFIKLLTLYICCFIKNKSLAQVLSCEFCEICKNTFFAEHHQTTASYYSSIIGNEERISKRNCKLWYKIKAYVPTWGRSVSYQKRTTLVKFDQVSEAVVHRFSSKQMFLKFSQIPKENICVGDTFFKKLQCWRLC